MQGIRRAMAWLVVPFTAAVIGIAMFASSPAHAATPACHLVSGCHSWNVPLRGGLDIDALNWGINPQTGNPYNDEVVVWSENSAGRAADFTMIQIATSVAVVHPIPLGAMGVFIMEFSPNGVPSGYCVSMITDAQGAYARLRPCALASTLTGALPTTFNPWQTFTGVPQGDGFFQLEAYGESTPYVLNDRGWGGNGSPVISYPGTGAAENQIWETNP